MNAKSAFLECTRSFWRVQIETMKEWAIFNYLQEPVRKLPTTDSEVSRLQTLVGEKNECEILTLPVSCAANTGYIRFLINMTGRVVHCTVPSIRLQKQMSRQVWGHTPEQRVDAFTLQRYSFGLRLAIPLAMARRITDSETDSLTKSTYRRKW